MQPPRMMQQSSTGPIRQRARFTRFTCHICDKVFATPETLNQHIATHRAPQMGAHRSPQIGAHLTPQIAPQRVPPQKLLSFKCNLCNAQYPSRQGLEQHKLTYHRNAQSQGSEMVCPVVNLNQPGVIDKLSSIGIRHCVVLSQITGQPNGIFGLPIVSIDSATNPAQSNSGRGPSNICSLGPPKPVRQ